MLLVLAATEIELKAFQSSTRKNDDRIMAAVCGMGPVEAAARVMKLFGDHNRKIQNVLNFGIGGAYLPDPASAGIGLLDVCLAESEVLGDYGVCFADRVESFADKQTAGKAEFILDNDLIEVARQELFSKAIQFSSGTFVTVNGASGTAERGLFLKKKFNGICENMEGAAIARCCEMYSLPMLEVRVISNMVEDRPGSPWRLEEACSRSGHLAALLADRLTKERL